MLILSPHRVPITYALVVGSNGGGQTLGLNNNNMQGWAAGSHSTGTPLLALVAPARQPFVGDWVHLTCIRSDSFLDLYIDGKLNTHIVKYTGYDNTTGGNKPYYGSTLKTWIGARDNRAGEYFDGKIDDIRLYDRAITSCEVMELYLEKHPCRQGLFDTTWTKISVTDTLIINANLTGVSKPNNVVRLLVYPNPTNDKITIDVKDFTRMSGYAMKITDVLSKEVWKTNVTKSSYTIDLNTFGGKGTYFITIYDASNKMVDVRKIILQ